MTDLSRVQSTARALQDNIARVIVGKAQTVTLPRTPSQTPAQYAATLARAAPEGAEAVATLTSTYLRARYAAEAPSLEEAHSAESAAAQLKSMAEEEKRR